MVRSGARKEIARIILVFILGVFVAGCASVPVRSPITLKDEIFLKDFCAREKISSQWDHISEVVSFKWRNSQQRILVGSNVAVVGNHRIVLSSPVRIQNSLIIVPSSFEKMIEEVLVIEPKVAVTEEFTIKKIQRIIIDPGHGGKDPGAIGLSGIYEKGIVLDIALKLKDLLSQKGWDVSLTRSTDDFISLGERTQIASDRAADIFVSVHANSNPSSKIYGVEVYSLRDLDRSEFREEQRLKNEETVFGHFVMEKNNNDLKDVLSEMMYSSKQSESLLLASLVADNVVFETKTANRGQRYAKFFVLRNTLSPAILVEVGYVSNMKEENFLKSEDYRTKIAKGIAEGIFQYAGIE